MNDIDIEEPGSTDPDEDTVDSDEPTENEDGIEELELGEK